jgi:glycosyltransferase involved in cell wall biosynthesis
MRILFLARWFPFPPDNGSKKRCFNLIKILASKFEVDLISFSTEPVAVERLKGLEPYCQSVQAILYKDYNPHSFRARLGYFSTQPRFIYETYQKEFREAVRKACRTSNYELVIASQVDMTPYTKDIGCTKVLIDEIELTILKEEREKQVGGLLKTRASLTWWKHTHYIKSIIRRVDGLTVVSDNEKKILSELNHAKCQIQIIPNGIEMDYYSGDWGPPEPDTMIYAGALTYHANLDAMQYFITDIFPIIKKRRPAVKLFITGKLNDSIKSKLPSDPQVIFTGYVEDVRPWIGKTWLSVIPLRIGGGTRLKILESLAMGIPVVSTRKGAEGLALVPGRDLLIGDIPEEFADEAVKIFENKELRDQLGKAGKSSTGSFYDWTLVGGRFLQYVDEIVSKK